MARFLVREVVVYGEWRYTMQSRVLRRVVRAGVARYVDGLEA